MKYRKLCKRLIAFTLCITIGIQSFFSFELPVYAGQSTPSAIDSLEGLLYEDSTDISDIEMYDDTGTKLIPVSLEVEEFNAQYANLNPPIDSDSIPQTRSLIVTLSMLIGTITIGLIASKAIIGISRKFCVYFRDYLVQYSYPSHERVFNDTPFSYTNSEGEKIETVITQEMMENLGAKLEAYEAGRIWEMVFLLTEEDKLCLTYTMYQHKALTNLKRENIKVEQILDSSFAEKYPYYVLGRASCDSGTVAQFCFDKKPIGCFYGTDSYNYIYDYDGNVVDCDRSELIFYSAYKLMYDNGVIMAYVDICQSAMIPYKYNSTLRIYETTNNYTEYNIGEGPYAVLDSSHLPFNVFNIGNARAVNLNSKYLGMALSTKTPVFSDDGGSISDTGAQIINTPRIGNIEDYYNALPKNLSIRKEFDINNVLNYGEGATALNPAGVLSWDDVIEKPTEIPTESVKPSESVQPGESVKPSEGTGGDSGAITITLTSILTKLSNLFDWIKANLTAAAFAAAVVSALGLTTLFQTITTPLSSILSYCISLFNKVSDIANWDIDAWIVGGLAAPLAHLVAIDNIISDIADWDIDAIVRAVPKFLNIDTTLAALAVTLAAWNFADWPMSMAQTLRDVLTHPLSALQTATDAIAKALDNVATWDLKTALKALENAITGALTGALTVAGITSIIDILTNIKDIALEAVGGSDDNSSDSNTDNDFFNFAKLLYILIAIIILLIILFLNCLRFIILIFSIPASTAFLNEDILKGIEYVKNLQVEKFNLSLYDIIVGVVYFLLFLAIIKAIRNKIDKIHI